MSVCFGSGFFCSSNHQIYTWYQRCGKVFFNYIFFFIFTKLQNLLYILPCRHAGCVAVILLSVPLSTNVEGFLFVVAKLELFIGFDYKNACHPLAHHYNHLVERQEQEWYDDWHSMDFWLIVSDCSSLFYTWFTHVENSKALQCDIFSISAQGSMCNCRWSFGQPSVNPLNVWNLKCKIAPDGSNIQ